MKINYTNDAAQSLIALVDFIEKQNTKGAGLRWLAKFELSIKKSLKNFSIIPFCKNKTFYSLQLKCFYFNDWLIAFSQQQNSLTIEALLHKSRVKD